MKKILQYTLLMVVLSACSKKDKNQAPVVNTNPVVANDGQTIVFPVKQTVSFFETEVVGDGSLENMVQAPAKVAATVVRSDEGASQNIVLFENPDLASNYTQLLQHRNNINQLINKVIKQKQTEVARTEDLKANGAATGRDLLEAQTALSVEMSNLANEKAAIIEHETKLKAGGFNPQLLQKASAGTSFIICDVPENEISKIKEGNTCTITFTAYPDQKFTGRIEDIADMVDPSTRMIKLRISINDAGGKLRSGMFGTVSFGLNEGKQLSVDKNALVTVQGKNFVFVKTGPDTFVRREVELGDEVGDRMVVTQGLQSGDAVAIKGVMQLKGLSFGY